MSVDSMKCHHKIIITILHGISSSVKSCSEIRENFGKKGKNEGNSIFTLKFGLIQGQGSFVIHFGVFQKIPFHFIDFIDSFKCIEKDSC